MRQDRGMRVEIDYERCTGHGRCYALAPDVFTVRDDGYGEVAATGELEGELLDHARRAVDNCPEEAIRLVD